MPPRRKAAKSSSQAEVSPPNSDKENAPNSVFSLSGSNMDSSKGKGKGRSTKLANKPREATVEEVEEEDFDDLAELQPAKRKKTSHDENEDEVTEVPSKKKPASRSSAAKGKGKSTASKGTAKSRSKKALQEVQEDEDDQKEEERGEEGTPTGSDAGTRESTEQPEQQDDGDPMEIEEEKPARRSTRARTTRAASNSVVTVNGSTGTRGTGRGKTKEKAKDLGDKTVTANMISRLEAESAALKEALEQSRNSFQEVRNIRETEWEGAWRTLKEQTDERHEKTRKTVDIYRKDALELREENESLKAQLRTAAFTADSSMSSSADTSRRKSANALEDLLRMEKDNLKRELEEKKADVLKFKAESEGSQKEMAEQVKQLETELQAEIQQHKLTQQKLKSSASAPNPTLNSGLGGPSRLNPISAAGGANAELEDSKLRMMEDLTGLVISNVKREPGEKGAICTIYNCLLTGAKDLTINFHLRHFKGSGYEFVPLFDASRDAKLVHSWRDRRSPFTENISFNEYGLASFWKKLFTEVNRRD